MEEIKNDQGVKVVSWVGELYCKFVWDSAKITKPLLNFLKKSVLKILDGHCYRAFRELKCYLTSTPVLKFPEFKKSFKVHIDASNFVIGGILMQEGRPVVFESKKLLDVERRWPTHKKEMWVVVHCLKLWQHYLELEYTKVYMDNVSVQYSINITKYKY